MNKETTIAITLTSNEYVEKDALQQAVFDLEETLKAERRYGDDEIKDLLSALYKLEAETRTERIKKPGSKTYTDEEVPNDIELTFNMEVDDLLTQVHDAKCQELWDFVVANWDDDSFVEQVKDNGDWPNHFVKAIDQLPCDFKRYMCDVFETGYHIDSWELLKLVAEKLDKDFKSLL